jgi:hypothetical protein
MGDLSLSSWHALSPLSLFLLSFSVSMYGFHRLTSGPDEGGFQHRLFRKGRPELCLQLKRVSEFEVVPKAVAAAATSNEEQEEGTVSWSHLNKEGGKKRAAEAALPEDFPEAEEQGGEDDESYDA